MGRVAPSSVPVSAPIAAGSTLTPDIDKIALEEENRKSVVKFKPLPMVSPDKSHILDPDIHHVDIPFPRDEPSGSNRKPLETSMGIKGLGDTASASK